MDQKKILNLEYIGLAFGILATFIFHQLYEWTNSNVLIGLISPVNESVWEHTKLIFFPFLIFGLIELFVLKPKDPINFIATKFISAIVGVLSLLSLFYLYTAIAGDNYLIADIIIGFIAVFISFYISKSFLTNNKKFKYANLINIVGVALIALYFIFSYLPPNFSMFIEGA